MNSNTINLINLIKHIGQYNSFILLIHNITYCMRGIMKGLSAVFILIINIRTAGMWLIRMISEGAWRLFPLSPLRGFHPKASYLIHTRTYIHSLGFAAPAGLRALPARCFFRYPDAEETVRHLSRTQQHTLAHTRLYIHTYIQKYRPYTYHKSNIIISMIL